MTLTVNDYDIEFARVLAGLEAEGYTFERRQHGETVVYILIGDGLEYGRWTISPPRGRRKHVQIMRHATAISRGCDTSMRTHGNMEHLPEEERRRHAAFGDAWDEVRSAVEFAHGLGDWADFWREHDAQTEQCETEASEEGAATHTERDEDGIRIGARKLTERDPDDPDIQFRRAKLREYLERLLVKHQSQRQAEQLMGISRSNLERWRKCFPEIEQEVMAKSHKHE